MTALRHDARPGTARSRGVVVPALLAAAAVLLGGCSDAVGVDVPDLDEQEARACAALVDDLPQELFGQERREVDPADAPAAAWGDPAVVLSCGVGVPSEYDEFSSCLEIDGVGWFVPPQQLKEFDGEVELTALTHSPRVALVVPGEHRSEGPDSQLADLAPLVREHLAETSPCR